jgi:hypothetical protein
MLKLCTSSCELIQWFVIWDMRLVNMSCCVYLLIVYFCSVIEVGTGQVAVAGSYIALFCCYLLDYISWKGCLKVKGDIYNRTNIQATLVFTEMEPLCKAGPRRQVAATREEIFRRLSEGVQVNQQAAEPMENNCQQSSVPQLGPWFMHAD